MVVAASFRLLNCEYLKSGRSHKVETYTIGISVPSSTKYQILIFARTSPFSMKIVRWCYHCYTGPGQKSTCTTRAVYGKQCLQWYGIGPRAWGAANGRPKSGTLNHYTHGQALLYVYIYIYTYKRVVCVCWFVGLSAFYRPHDICPLCGAASEYSESSQAVAGGPARAAQASMHAQREHARMPYNFTTKKSQR